MDTELELEPHEFIDKAVGKHEGDEFAEFNNISRSTYEKWSRKPTSDEAPSATGMINPIKRVDRIFDWFLLRAPYLAVAFIERYSRRLRCFRERQTQQPLTQHEYRAHLARVIQENADVLTALTTGAPIKVLAEEVAQFQAELDSLMMRLQRSEKAPDLTPFQADRKHR